jgi:hypothetical protein
MYQLTDSTAIYRLDDGALIPADPENSDYQAYLAWCADGNAPEPAQGPSKEARINVLQGAYDLDLDKLNRAWLSALIADGEGEIARQAVIKQQMADLETQLEQDILNIIMEE